MADHHTPSNVEPLPFTAEEMKAIGEIELGPSRHEKFLNAHYKKLIVAVAVFMIVAVACIVYGTWRTRQEADSASTVIAAMKATQAGETADAAGYDLATLEKVAADYPGTQAAGTAELLRGMQQVAGGQEQQGVATLEGVIASTADAFLRVRAQVFLAGHYMSGGNTQKASELWQAISRAGATPYLALSYLNLGDMANDAGEVEQARSFYNKLQEECASSPLVDVAQQRLLLLGVDAPEPVAPESENKPAEEEIPTWNSVDFSSGLKQ